MGRVELTIAVDVAPRTICAALLRPTGTGADRCPTAVTVTPPSWTGTAGVRRFLTG